MVEIIHRYLCDYCGAVHVEEVGKNITPLMPLVHGFYAPRDWAWLNEKLVYNKHWVTVKDKEDKQ